ncbi:MAG: hypothetical protein RLZ55_1142 [Actinomycetota bacterium]
MREFKTIVVFVVAVVLVAVIAGVGYLVWGKWENDKRQSALASFYQTPSPLPAGKPGDVLKSEPITSGFTLPAGTQAQRIMYLTQGPNGEPRVSSGMVFTPAGAPPDGGRKVVSWAHPTVGMGDSCAPSRAANHDLLTWLPGMLNLGWVVTATDYAGLGTDGTELYLVGKSEAYDVINAVRAAQRLPGTGAGSDYAVYGHSQGGHAAMWTGAVAPQYAPELTLVGVAGAAAAAALSDLVDELWNTNTAWVIGAEVFESFPLVYPNLALDAVGTPDAVTGYQEVAEKCLIDGILDGEVRGFFDERFFSKNPNDDPSWRTAIAEQSAPPLNATMPALVIESVNDGVVLPPSIVALQREWCAAGSNLAVQWLGPLRGTPETLNLQTHMYEGSIGGALATGWIGDRFAGRPAVPNCEQPAPLALTSTN